MPADYTLPIEGYKNKFDYVKSELLNPSKYCEISLSDIVDIKLYDNQMKVKFKAYGKLGASWIGTEWRAIYLHESEQILNELGLRFTRIESSPPLGSWTTSYDHFAQPLSRKLFRYYDSHPRTLKAIYPSNPSKLEDGTYVTYITPDFLIKSFKISNVIFDNEFEWNQSAVDSAVEEAFHYFTEKLNNDMGIETQFRLRVKIKYSDMPRYLSNVLDEVINCGYYMNKDESLSKDLTHPFFSCSRWCGLLVSTNGGCVRGSSFSYDYKTDLYTLDIHTEFRNYEDEIAKFLDLIKPLIYKPEPDMIYGYWSEDNEQPHDIIL